MVKDMIRAYCHSDDWHIVANLDASEYINKCTDDEIRALHRIGWGGDYESDWVAQYFSESTLKEFFDYLAYGKGGYECQIDEESIMTWLQGNRPHLYKEFKEQE